MAYFNFLKYLRSLEEFRKNPHVKIPPKSSCANFQSLDIFKNLFFLQKEIFFGFRPIRPSPAPRWPAAPQTAGAPLDPLGPSRVGVFSERRILFDIAHSSRDAFSLTSPPCGARLSALSRSPRQPTVVASSHHLQPPCTARPPTSGCEARSSLHALIPPLNFPP
jgi:hypothetical protein